MMARILNLIGIGKATRTDDSRPVQTIQVTEGASGAGGTERVTDKVQRIGEYGFATVLPDDAEVLVLRRNGERANGIVIATQHRASRPTGLEAGDVWVYDARGRSIRFTDGGIEVHAAGNVVTVTDAEKVRCTCDIETTGDVISRADSVPVSLNKLRDAYDDHIHPPVAGATSWGSGPPDKHA